MSLVGNVRIEIDEILRRLAKIAQGRLPTSALSGKLVLEDLEAGLQVGVRFDELGEADAFDDLDEDERFLIALTHHAEDVAEHADLVEVAGTGHVEVGVLLRGEPEEPPLRQQFIEETPARGPLHGEGRDSAGKKDDPAQGHHRDDLGQVGAPFRHFGIGPARRDLDDLAGGFVEESFKVFHS